MSWPIPISILVHITPVPPTSLSWGLPADSYISVTQTGAPVMFVANPQFHTTLLCASSLWMLNHEIERWMVEKSTTVKAQIISYKWLNACLDVLDRLSWTINGVIDWLITGISGHNCNDWAGPACISWLSWLTNMDVDHPYILSEWRWFSQCLKKCYFIYYISCISCCIYICIIIIMIITIINKNK